MWFMIVAFYDGYTLQQEKSILVLEANKHDSKELHTHFKNVELQLSYLSSEDTMVCLSRLVQIFQIMFVTLGIMLCLEFSTRPLGDANGNHGDETVSPLSFELKTQ